MKYLNDSCLFGLAKNVKKCNSSGNAGRAAHYRYRFVSSCPVGWLIPSHLCFLLQVTSLRKDMRRRRPNFLLPTSSRLQVRTPYLSFLLDKHNCISPAISHFSVPASTKNIFAFLNKAAYLYSFDQICLWFHVSHSNDPVPHNQCYAAYY